MDITRTKCPFHPQVYPRNARNQLHPAMKKLIVCFFQFRSNNEWDLLTIPLPYIKLRSFWVMQHYRLLSNISHKYRQTAWCFKNLTWEALGSWVKGELFHPPKSNPLTKLYLASTHPYLKNRSYGIRYFYSFYMK